MRMESYHTMNNFSRFLLESKAAISKEIQNIIIYNKEIFNSTPNMGSWLSQEMMDFSTTGKMLRGALALLGAKLFATDSSEIYTQATQLAAGLELLQAGLLVHDDIMDHDETRRGKPTCHIRLAHRFTEKGAVSSSVDALKAAEAQGICVGDLFFFLAWKTLSALPASVSSRVAHEHALVTLAQMRDVEFGYGAESPSLQDVLEMYRLKTARYTVALPLTAGALLSYSDNVAAREDSVSFNRLKAALDQYGEAMGLVFQLQDDRLGLFGDEKELGKPVGSDIKEGKKTPYILSLLPKLSIDEHATFFSFFGTPSINSSNIEWLRSTVIAHGVEEELRTLIEGFTVQALSSLQVLASMPEIAPTTIEMLRNFIEFSNARSR